MTQAKTTEDTTSHPLDTYALSTRNPFAKNREPFWKPLCCLVRTLIRPADPPAIAPTSFLQVAFTGQPGRLPTTRTHA